MPNPFRVAEIDPLPFVVAPHPYQYYKDVWEPANAVTESMFDGIGTMLSETRHAFCTRVEGDAFNAVQRKFDYTYSAGGWEAVVGMIECLKMRLDIIGKAAAERASARRHAARTTEEATYQILRDEHEEERSRLARAADAAAAAEREAVTA
jgi:hypothetical protein